MHRHGTRMPNDVKALCEEVQATNVAALRFMEKNHSDLKQQQTLEKS